METEIFKAGTRHGAPTTNDEIKILVCYILSKTDASMSFQQLHESFSENELVNYFELVSAVDSLIDTGHIAEEESGAASVYRITPLGEDAANTVNTLLPLSVREKASVAAKKLLRRKKREKEVVVKISEINGGFEVLLALPGDKGSLLSFTVFCPTRDEAQLVRKRFLNDPAYIYKGVMALLTGDKNVIGKMFPSDDDLF
ncbi:MAG: DUF4364 family protein [Oscillospiraceae bacterium]|nr:DUF4364 family protein [Oscillospiraceae bacterium]